MLITLRHSLLSITLLLLIAPVTNAKDPKYEFTFAPRPPVDELTARNPEEVRAGVVMLSYDISIDPKLLRTLEVHQVRYLVLDESGVQDVAQHKFVSLDEEGQEILHLQGQTIDAQGQIFPLDPQKDVRTLEARSGDGDTERAVKTVAFPRVEPGAILDLAWVIERGAAYGLHVFTLQQEFPVRDYRLYSEGRTAAFRWVPYLLGEIPESAHARLTKGMELTLTVKDLGVNRFEPRAPNPVRNATLLILSKEGFPGKRWREYVRLWQRPNIPQDAEHYEADLDPAAALVTLDHLGLQEIPAWKENGTYMEGVQSSLDYARNGDARFWRKNEGAESEADVERIAPSTLPVHERAAKLFLHARDRVRIDYDARDMPRLDRLLDAGEGTPDNVSLYFRYLLRQAGIENRPVVALSRDAVPFLPVFNTFRPFEANFLVEVGPSGDRRYYAPNSKTTNPYTIDGDHVGALILRRPFAKGRWTVERIRPDYPYRARTSYEVSSPLPVDGAVVTVTTSMVAEDASAAILRRGFVLHASEKQREKLPDRYAEKLAGSIVAGLFGETFDRDSVSVEFTDAQRFMIPLGIEVTGEWRPTVQDLGDQLIAPLLPQGSRFDNPFVDEDRQHPFWLNGGQYSYQFHWQLPDGYRLAETLAPVAQDGPGGLHYEIDVADQGSVVTVTLSVSSPLMLPVTEQAGVRTFFQNLQRDAERQMLLTRS